MKAGLLAVAALSAVAFAQPHVRHQQLHEEKRDVVVTQYETDVVTATAQGAVVYVDQYGNKIDGPAEATPTPSPSPAASPDVKQNWQHEQHQAPSSSTTQAPPPSTPTPSPSPSTPANNAPAAPAPVVSSAAAIVPAAPAPSVASSAPAAQNSPSTSSAGGIAKGVGITYSPYTASGCKTTDQIKADLQILSGYSSYRVYNADCNAISVILGNTDKTIMIGVNNEKINDPAGQVSAISAQVGNNWSRVEAIAVGNEGVNNKIYDVATISSAVSAFKSQLSKSNINTKVITVDTAVAIVANKGLCKVGDFVAANSHAFWNGATPAGNAGPFVLQSAQDVAGACGGNVVITESGWPNAGPAFQSSIANEANAQAAASSLQKSFSNNLYLFNAFNTPNVADPAQNHWGVHGDSAAK